MNSLLSISDVLNTVYNFQMSPIREPQARRDRTRALLTELDSNTLETPNRQQLELHRNRHLKLKKTAEGLSQTLTSLSGVAHAKRVLKTSSSKTKLRILAWMLRKKVYLEPGATKVRLAEGLQYHYDAERRMQYRPATLSETAKHWKRAVSNISNWWKNRHAMMLVTGSSRKAGSRYQQEYFPRLEAALFESYEKRLSLNLLITTAWFHREVLRLWPKVYEPEIRLGTLPERNSRFSMSWLNHFRTRHKIKRRRVTHVAQRLPVDWKLTAVRMVAYNRRCLAGMVNAHGRVEVGMLPDVSLPIEPQIPAYLICNIDETPLGFEEMANYNYVGEGSKTVELNTSKSGWEKRKMTILVPIFADGLIHVKPLIIFHGTPTDRGGRLFHQEGHLYHPDVIVKYNKTAWMNEKLMLEWLEEEWRSAVVRASRGEIFCLSIHSHFLTQKSQKPSSHR